MCATGGFYCDLGLAEGADLGGGSLGFLNGFLFLLFERFELLLGAHHNSDDNEDRECNEQEVDNCLNEHTVGDGNLGLGLNQFTGCGIKLLDRLNKDVFKTLKVNVTGNECDKGVDDVGNQGRHEGLECGTDENTDSHVEYVALADKCFEI